MISLKRKVFFALFLMFAGVAFASAEGWQRFTSSTGFSVSYPGSWFRTGISTDRLQLRSSRGGAEGVGIRDGQAEITVIEAQSSSSQALAQVIAYYTRDARVTSHKRVSAQADKSACSSLEEVTSKEPAVPRPDSPITVPNIVNTDFFCEVQGRKIVTLLRNWEGDKRQQEYQQVALQMAKGIQLAPLENAR